MLAPLVLAAVVLAQAPETVTVLEAGSAGWRYQDDGPAPPPSWNQPGFDDSSWSSGPAPLGYGEDHLATRIGFGPDPARKRITARFRRRVRLPPLEAGRRYVLSFCVDDGAIVYLNGTEVGRLNMPDDRVDAETKALDAIAEGYYARLVVPPELVLPGPENLLAVEVHQASASSSDLFFDLAVKSSPVAAPAPAVLDSARDVVAAYRERHYIRPGLRVPDGYMDGGRQARFDDARVPHSGREILQVDRTRDVGLIRDITFARSERISSLPRLDRIRAIAARIDRECTPPGGPYWTLPTTTALAEELADHPILIGEWVEQGHAGVCRHRALLFKILADEAGLDAALVRGNYVVAGQPASPHIWNEVALDDGIRVLVDTSLEGAEPRCPEVTIPEVIASYRRVDDTAWYGTGGK